MKISYICTLHELQIILCLKQQVLGHTMGPCIGIEYVKVFEYRLLHVVTYYHVEWKMDLLTTYSVGEAALITLRWRMTVIRIRIQNPMVAIASKKKTKSLFQSPVNDTICIELISHYYLLHRIQDTSISRVQIFFRIDWWSQSFASFLGEKQGGTVYTVQCTVYSIGTCSVPNKWEAPKTWRIMKRNQT